MRFLNPKGYIGLLLALFFGVEVRGDNLIFAIFVLVLWIYLDYFKKNERTNKE